MNAEARRQGGPRVVSYSVARFGRDLVNEELCEIGDEGDRARPYVRVMRNGERKRYFKIPVRNLIDIDLEVAGIPPGDGDKGDDPGNREQAREIARERKHENIRDSFDEVVFAEGDRPILG